MSGQVTGTTHLGTSQIPLRLGRQQHDRDLISVELQLLGRPQGDHALLRVAAAYEAV